MNFIGPWVNTIAVMMGGGIGSMIGGGKLSKKNFRSMLLLVFGLLVVGVGVMSFMDSFFVLDKMTQDGKEVKMLETPGTLLVAIALLVGWLLGRAMAVEGSLRKLGAFLFDKVAGSSVASAKTKTDKTLRDEKREHFAEGFVLAVMVVCTGSMVIYGPAAYGPSYAIYIKSAVDLVLTVALSMIYGIGVAFAAGAVLIVELIVALLAKFGGEFFTETLIRQLATVGSCLMVITGLNVTFGKKYKVANFLPALIIPIIYQGIASIFVEMAGK